MRQITALLLLVWLTACGNAKWTSIYRTHLPSKGHGNSSALIDAKQRAIISAPILSTDDDVFKPNRAFLVCAEPSPDAVSALSSALSTSIGVDVLGQGSGEGSLAFALSEAVGKLGKRNATIQLLRDGFYRQCEAYLNGLIDAEGYQQTSGRFVDAMVTLLAIEQVTSPSVRDTPLTIRSEAASADTNINLQPSPALKDDSSKSIKRSSNLPADEAKAETESPAVSKSSPGNGNEETSQNDNGSSNGKLEQTEKKRKITAGANATGDRLNVDLYTLNSSPISEQIAREVKEMVNIFLTKDARDRCLETISDFSRRLEDQIVASEDEKKLINNFTQLCFDVIRSSLGVRSVPEEALNLPPDIGPSSQPQKL